MILCTDLKSERRELPLAMPPHYPIRDMLEILRWLDVEHSPRYQPGDGSTWCNVFACDVAACWGAVLPHWITSDQAPALPYRGRELTANATVRWLRLHGQRYGWGPVSRPADYDAEAFVIGIWESPRGQHGHVAVVRPGPARDDGPWIAQAGARCFSAGVVAEGFGRAVPEWWRWTKSASA